MSSWNPTVTTAASSHMLIENPSSPKEKGIESAVHAIVTQARPEQTSSADVPETRLPDFQIIKKELDEWKEKGMFGEYQLAVNVIKDYIQSPKTCLDLSRIERLYYLPLELAGIIKKINPPEFKCSKEVVGDAFNRLIVKGDLEMCKWLFKHTVEMALKDWSNAHNEPPIWTAIWNRQVQICQWLLEEKLVEDINKAYFACGETALITAVKQGCKEIVEMLLKEGASPSAQDHRGNVLEHAVRGGNVDIVEILLKTGIDPHALVGRVSGLDWSIMKGHTKIAQLLMEYGNRPFPMLDLVRSRIANGVEGYGEVLKLMNAAICDKEGTNAGQRK